MNQETSIALCKKIIYLCTLSYLYAFKRCFEKISFKY